MKKMKPPMMSNGSRPVTMMPSHDVSGGSLAVNAGSVWLPSFAAAWTSGYASASRPGTITLYGVPPPLGVTVSFEPSCRMLVTPPALTSLRKVE